MTRVISIIPVLICAFVFGSTEGALDEVLIYSQVFLCVALPISMIPLVYFTSSKKIMGAKYANPKWLVALGWLVVIVLTVLNAQLVIHDVMSWFGV